MLIINADQVCNPVLTALEAGNHVILIASAIIRRGEYDRHIQLIGLDFANTLRPS